MSRAALPSGRVRREAKAGGSGLGGAQGTGPLGCPRKQRWKPLAQFSPAPDSSANPDRAQPGVSELVQQPFVYRFGRQDPERDSYLLKVTQQVGSRSESQTRGSCLSNEGSIWTLSPRATCRPAFLLSEPRTMPVRGPRTPLVL